MFLSIVPEPAIIFKIKSRVNLIVFVNGLPKSLIYLFSTPGISKVLHMEPNGTLGPTSFNWVGEDGGIQTL